MQNVLDFTYSLIGSLNRLPQTQDTLLDKPSHTITLGENSILSLACSNKYLFSGSQGPNIQVNIMNFSIEIFENLIKTHNYFRYGKLIH